MAREVVVFPRAENGHPAGNAYRIQRGVSISSSRRWNRRIVAAIAALTNNADRYPEADEAADLGLDLRCKLHGRRPNVYRILFTIDGDTVNVLRVRHAAQDTLADDDL